MKRSGPRTKNAIAPRQSPPDAKTRKSTPDPARVIPEISRHLVDIDSVSADPANLRQHDARSIESIRASLRRFGQQKPIVVDARDIVVAGNGTLEAARSLGWKRIAAVRSDLVGIDRTAYSIADNRTGELSTWDQQALRATLRDLDPDSLESTGFTPGEVAELADVADGPLEEDETPEPLPRPVTRHGELWILGGEEGHRLQCGDSTDAAEVARLMDSHQAALVSTDPPYLVDYTGKRGNDSGKDWSGVYKEVEIKDAERFFRGVFMRVLEVLAPHAAVYCWHAHKRVGMIQKLWNELGILDHQQIIWVKPASVMGRAMYHFQHEPCVMGWREGSKPHDHQPAEHTTVWVVPFDERTSVRTSEHSDVWFEDWEGKARVTGNEHPTQKPLELFARPIRKHTLPGAICFEPFSGSGSQLIAAEKTGRRCFAMELQPVFVDVAIRRWQKLTGQAARLGGDGRTWAEIARDRGIDTEATSCPASHHTPAATPDVAPSRKRGSARSTRKSTPKSKPGGRRRDRQLSGATAPSGSDSEE